MKLVAPSWYPDFHCTAGACRHSCCREGWGIDIDPNSAARYLSLPGQLGDRVRSAMTCEDGCYSFRMNEDGVCPLLESDGLCSLINAFGEPGLCEICHEHPRFYHDYADFAEVGAGLCCEEAVRLLLTSDEPLKLITVEDDLQEDEADPMEQAFLRSRDKLLAIASGDEPLSARTERLLAAVRLTGIPCHLPAAFWLSLESLEQAWQALLSRLEKETIPAASWDAQEDDPRFSRLSEYILYRHLPDALDSGDLAGQVLLCVRLLVLVRQLAALPQTDLAEIIRLMSGEIEYSDENGQLIMDA